MLASLSQQSPRTLPTITPDTVRDDRGWKSRITGLEVGPRYR